MRRITLALIVLVLTACGGSGGATAPADTTGATGSAAPSAVASVVASTAAASTAASAPAASAGADSGTVPGDAADQQVIDALAQEVNQPATALTVQNKEEKDWPSGGLGCEAPGQMYTQVIVPGYQYTISDGTTTYTVHTDARGSSVVLCQNGKPTMLSSN